MNIAVVLDKDTVAEAWPSVQDELQKEVGADAYANWFSRMQFEGMGNGIVRFSVPTPFLKSWITARYQEQVLAACRVCWPSVRRIAVDMRTPVLKSLCKPAARAVAPVPAPLPFRFAPKSTGEESTVSSEESANPTHLEGVPAFLAVEKIQHVVAVAFGLTRRDLVATSRRGDVIIPRQVGMYLSKRLTTRAAADIGRRFGGRDHTTVLHAVRKISMLVGEDPPPDFPENSESSLQKLEIDPDLADKVAQLKSELERRRQLGV